MQLAFLLVHTSTDSCEENHSRCTVHMSERSMVGGGDCATKQALESFHLRDGRHLLDRMSTIKSPDNDLTRQWELAQVYLAARIQNLASG